METPYNFTRDDLATLILRRFYPERTDRESTILRDFLLSRGDEFDRFSFSVRVGRGETPDPMHLPAVQRNTVFSTRKRIDMLAWRGTQPVIVEVKERVTPAALGQIRTYRTLFVEENPDAPEPELVVIGRYSDDDTLRAMQAEGITVYLYPPADAAAATAVGGL